MKSRREILETGAHASLCVLRRPRQRQCRYLAADYVGDRPEMTLAAGSRLGPRGLSD
jgi:hypothetical protein